MNNNNSSHSSNLPHSSDLSDSSNLSSLSNSSGLDDSSGLSSLSDSMPLDVLRCYCDDLYEIIDAWVNSTNCEVTPSMSNIVFSFYGLAHDATHGDVDEERALETIRSILDILHLETMYHYSESNQTLCDKISELTRLVHDSLTS